MSNATLLREVLRELALPTPPAKPAPIRRGPLHWFTYTIEDMTGWWLDIGYRWDRESAEDAIDVEIVGVLLYTPAGNTNLDESALGENRERIEDAIRDEVEKRLEAERDDRDTRWERSR